MFPVFGYINVARQFVPALTAEKRFKTENNQVLEYLKQLGSRELTFLIKLVKLDNNRICQELEGYAVQVNSKKYSKPCLSNYCQIFYRSSAARAISFSLEAIKVFYLYFRTPSRKIVQSLSSKTSWLSHITSAERLQQQFT